MKILNLYAGLGGNRRLWGDVDVTAVELVPEIAEEYAKLYPQDTVIVADAHEYLANNYGEFDFIWSSPPCQSHSRAAAKGHNMTPRYFDAKLWQEIVFLQTHAKCLWVVENVKSYYEPFIRPQVHGRHCFWANFHISAPHIDAPGAGTKDSYRSALADWLGFDYEGAIYYDGNHCPSQILRNCVHPELGKAVLDSAMGSVSFESMQEQMF